ncbi:MAG: chemotaxis protein [Salinarimonadaceae bacterium]|nr:MAG: chemotaxis protein [Salinarimonadaceae bacterium]
MASASARKTQSPERSHADAVVAPDGQVETGQSVNGQVDIGQIAQELTLVADYITRLKNEIGALRANELYRSRLPGAHDELGNVVSATATATNSIMASAEEILGYDDDTLEAYRERVQGKVMEIFEACSFQDITGQRITRVVEHLNQIEKRLSRFASAVNARDTDVAPDKEDAAKQTRKDVLLLHGPQDAGEGVAQSDIDALFD